MTVTLRKGHYLARLAETAADLTAAQALRHLCFVEQAGLNARPGGLDQDAFDARCQHLLIFDAQTGALAGSCRLMVLHNGTAIAHSYAAQTYDLSRLHNYPGCMVELGRFCVHPSASNADVLRVAWGALTRFVDNNSVQLLFGCASFPGTDAAPYKAAFDRLAAKHLAPAQWQPQIKAPNVVHFGADRLQIATGPMVMPPLLKTYLAMGGWVSDHAVVDTDMDTLHVFTGLEIAAIPAGRARALRAVAG